MPKKNTTNATVHIREDMLTDVALYQTLLKVRNGDFSVRFPVGRTGLSGKFCDAMNDIIDMNEQLVHETAKVREMIGKKGNFTERVELKGAKGSWDECAESINTLISDLVQPTNHIAHVISSVAKGDLSEEMPLTIDGHPLRGEFLRIAKDVNAMVKQLNVFSMEVTRVAREVGTEGKLGGQAKIKGVGGVWKDLTDSVNQMASNLTAQMRSIANVTIAVARGDLSKKVTVDVKGEISELKDAINTMVDQLNSFASEVTRVAREVGSEGKLGGQANVRGVAGVWKALTDSVNQMASNLTGQVRNIAEVTTAVAKGDLSRKITVDVKGEILQLKDTINTMVDQLNAFGSEVTRVAREVGSEGKLGGQANVPGVAGTWKDLTDSVNQMAGNLTGQVRNIAEVTTAVAKGNLSKKITVDVRGEIAELKDTINTMVDQLNAFGSEVTRVAREVGSEGKLGGQANVPGVGGTWKDLTDSVNQMASNLTGQVRNIAEVAAAVANGDLSRKITVDVRGEILQLKETMNTMVDQLRSFASEVTRVAREVGTDGKLGGQAFVPGVAGTWKDLTDSVNQMTGNLTSQVRNIAEVTKAVASGDLSKTVAIDVKGEILDLKNTINTMVDQLNSFAYEVTRVAREVGTEGKLGGQANVRGVAGIWKDLTDSVNQMAGNLTDQVRGIAKVVTSVAKGTLKQKLSIDAKGEVALLTDTINEMIDTLAVFADQVTTVAREVGAEGKLGGQAAVPGASGIWKDLTENVNQLAANLTTQVRAIADVASAVTKGDLSRTINVMAKGEVEALKDTINQMIANLKATTMRNQEQDWLKSNLAKLTQMLQGQKESHSVSRKILSELARIVSVQHGVFYQLDNSMSGEPRLKLLASYAYSERRPPVEEYKLGEGLIGQCALERERILLTNVPPEYIHITSGLGGAPPLNIMVLPVLFEGQMKAVIELASFETFSTTHISFFEQLTESIGIVLNTIESNMRTEELLQQSQKLAGELKSQQEELRLTNEELEEKARLLVKQKEEVEAKNMEVEIAKKSLEEKAAQLTITSQYKSEFLANMSHELRTPLNSLLILSQQLSENKDGNLTEKQVSYSKTIHSCGIDLINLINDILDLSKIESGVVTIDTAFISLHEIIDHIETTFRHMAEYKKLNFNIYMDPGLPEHFETDVHRLRQILKNLLSNAFKFTAEGSITFRIYPATHVLELSMVENDFVAFEIRDTGIGIPQDKLNIIFEAFQQAEGSTSRKYGGTGLGLSISRGLANLLGGFIELESRVNEGSTFTLYLPLKKNAQKTGPSPYPGSNGYSRSKSSGATSSITGDGYASRKTEPVVHIDDDREEVTADDQVILMIESNPSMANVIKEKAHNNGLKAVITAEALEAQELAERFKPVAVAVDINLNDVSGWKTLNLLKSNLTTRHIPVGIISIEEERMLSYRRGGFTFLSKPVLEKDLKNMFTDLLNCTTRKNKRLLVVEDDEKDILYIKAYLEFEGIEITFATSGKAAIEYISNTEYDLIVLDLRLPDISGFEVFEYIMSHKQHVRVPMLIYSARELSPEEEKKLCKVTHIIPKSVTSIEYLLDHIVLSLHIPHETLPREKKVIIENLKRSETLLKNKKILIVDDDIRNIFALTTIFEKLEANIFSAEGGREALAILEEHNDITVVLMDIMMPEMDGYETMRRIRARKEFATLPIIAVTAKAMRGDREKCIEAGASDYIMKPIDTSELLSLLKLWI